MKLSFNKYVFGNWDNRHTFARRKFEHLACHFQDVGVIEAFFLKQIQKRLHNLTIR